MIIEVSENGNLIVNQLDNVNMMKTSNTSHSKEIFVSHFDENKFTKMSQNPSNYLLSRFIFCLNLDNKFGTCVKRIASSSEALNSNKSEAESVTLPKMSTNFQNIEIKPEDLNTFQPKFSFKGSGFGNN